MHDEFAENVACSYGGFLRNVLVEFDIRLTFTPQLFSDWMTVGGYHTFAPLHRYKIITMDQWVILKIKLQKVSKE